jgi:phosphoribosyl 1,2-cyclic phosphodiesterase
MKVRLWGTRGSVASPGADTARYGGNTSCVEVRDGDGTVIVLDAGTGIRPLGMTLDAVQRVHILLTHLHMDHIIGLGFFEALFRPGLEVHLWGPTSISPFWKRRLT